MPRWPAGETPPRASTSYISARVSCLPPSSARAQSLRDRAKASSSSPSWRNRPAPRAITRGVRRSSIQRTSAAGTKCRVPLIGQVRTIRPSAMSRSTSSR